MSKQRVWFVTGASSGLGRLVTEQALMNGDIVVATLRTPSALSDLTSRYANNQLLVLKLDVTDYPEVKNALEKTVHVFGRCDIVFNNAGLGVLAEAEGTPFDAAKYMFDVNFWAATNVSREAVRVFRELNGKTADGVNVGGILLQMSSIAAFIGMPCVSYYCASKHALKGFTEALNKEMDPKWNIKIISLDLGFVRTEGNQKSLKFPIHEAYTDPALPTQQTRAYLKDDGKKILGNARIAVTKIFDVVNIDNPPVQLIFGLDAVEQIGQKLKEVNDELEKYRSWSDGMNQPDDFDDIRTKISPYNTENKLL